MQILILGAGGFLAPFIAEHLQVAGHTVIGLCRSHPSDMSGLSEHVAADREDVPGIVRTIAARDVDIVIDLLALTQAQTTPLITALQGRISRYVLASSCDVYKQYGVLHRKERGEPLAGPIDETAALRSTRHPYRGEQLRKPDDPLRWLDDYDKIPIEERLIVGGGPDWTILRLPMVFGPGDRQHRFRWIIEPIAQKASSVVAPHAWTAWRTTYGYVEDVAAGIALAATHPAAHRRIFNLGMDEAPAHTQWARRFAEIAGWSGEIVGNGNATTSLHHLAEQLDLSVPLVLSTRRIREELGYREVVDAETALRLTFADEVQRGMSGTS